MADWYTSAETAQVWGAGAPVGPALDELVEAAREQCIEYATNTSAEEWDAAREALGDAAPSIPMRWRRAHYLQIRALWNAEQASPQDTIGGETQSVRIYPMGQTIKDMLTPRRSMPEVG